MKNQTHKVAVCPLLCSKIRVGWQKERDTCKREAMDPQGCLTFFWIGFSSSWLIIENADPLIYISYGPYSSCLPPLSYLFIYYVTHNSLCSDAISTCHALNPLILDMDRNGPTTYPLGCPSGHTKHVWIWRSNRVVHHNI